MRVTTGAGLGLALLLAAAPAAESAGGVPRIGFLGVASAVEYDANVRPFREELRRLGYEEGKTLSIEYRWAEGRDERLPMLAAELVRLNPRVLVTHASAGIRAAQQATSTIPIVMGTSADPVRLGFVKSLAQPGGNTTGVASQLIDLSAKRLELLREAIPNFRHVAVLANLANEGAREAVKDIEVAARRLNVRVRSFDVKRELADLDAAFAALLRERPDGVIVIPDPVLIGRTTRIAELAVRHRLPVMGGDASVVADGGLMAYGIDFAEGWRLAARYVDKILKGAKPSELPVQQPTLFTFTINLKTARAIGMTIPPSLRLRADRVIE